jgi:hypothetical protein
MIKKEGKTEPEFKKNNNPQSSSSSFTHKDQTWIQQNPETTAMPADTCTTLAETDTDHIVISLTACTS